MVCVFFCDDDADGGFVATGLWHTRGHGRGMLALLLSDPKDVSQIMDTPTPPHNFEDGVDMLAYAFIHV